MQQVAGTYVHKLGEKPTRNHDVSDFLKFFDRPFSFSAGLSLQNVKELCKAVEAVPHCVAELKALDTGDGTLQRATCHGHM